MSLFGSSSENCHLTISAPSAGAIGSSAYTVAILFMPNLFSGDQMIWRAYDAANFSHRGLYVNGDMWIINQQAAAGIPNFGNPQKWYWFAVTKSTPDENPRAHWAICEEAGSLSWTHIDANSSQSNQTTINRLCLGDELSGQFKGNVACLTAFETELSDGQIEALFERSSLDILNASPDFFVHWPEADGLSSPFQDIAGGGIETIRTGNWAMSDDPPGFDFTLGRSGKPKVWNGTEWNKHQSKTFNGTIWNPSTMSGHDGTEWVASK